MAGLGSLSSATKKALTSGKKPATSTAKPKGATTVTGGSTGINYPAVKAKPSPVGAQSGLTQSLAATAYQPKAASSPIKPTSPPIPDHPNIYGVTPAGGGEDVYQVSPVGPVVSAGFENGLRSNEGTNPLLGWASQYIGGPNPADMYENMPGSLIRDSLSGMGIDAFGPLGNLFSQEAGPIRDMLNLILAGTTDSGQLVDAGAAINQLNSLINEMATPGGRIFDPNELMQMILEGASGGSTNLGGAFTGLDPTSQVALFGNMMEKMLDSVVNPYQQMALQNWYATEGEKWRSQAGKDPNAGSFGAHLRAGPFAPILGG